MSDVQGVAWLFGSAIAVAGVMALFHVRFSPRRRVPPLHATSHQEDEAATDPTVALGLFHRLAALFILFGLMGMVLAPWAAGLNASSTSRLGIVTLFVGPLIVGYMQLVARGGRWR